MKNKVSTETGRLQKIVIGRADTFSSNETFYDPRSLDSYRKGIYPAREALEKDLEGLVRVLTDLGVEVLRPYPIAQCNQIFSRDIGFVIDDYFFKSNCIEYKRTEQKGLGFMQQYFDIEKIIELPDDVAVEGGDVVLFGDVLFVGYSAPEDFERYTSARTNKAALDFLRRFFPNKEIIGLQLSKSDTDPLQNALHLDCAMMPIGDQKLIINPKHFLNTEGLETVKRKFAPRNIVTITQEQGSKLWSNLISVNSSVVISDPTFVGVNDALSALGIEIVGVSYRNVGLLGGLFRCSSMPLSREDV